MSKSYLDLKSAALYRCNQKYYDKVLSGFGLSYSGLIFLISIYEDEGLMLNKLAQDGSFDKGSITKAISKLEENGFVIIQDSKKDTVRLPYNPFSPSALAAYWRARPSATSSPKSMSSCLL